VHGHDGDRYVIEEVTREDTELALEEKAA